MGIARGYKAIKGIVKAKKAATALRNAKKAADAAKKARTAALKKAATQKKNIKVPGATSAQRQAARGTTPGKLRQVGGSPSTASKLSGKPPATTGQKLVQKALDPKSTPGLLAGTVKKGYQAGKFLGGKAMSPVGLAVYGGYQGGKALGLWGGGSEEEAATPASVGPTIANAKELQAAKDAGKEKGEGGTSGTDTEKMLRSRADMIKNQADADQARFERERTMAKDAEEKAREKLRAKSYESYEGGVRQYDEDKAALDAANTPSRRRASGLGYLLSEPERQANIRMRQFGTAKDKERAKSNNRATQLIQAVQGEAYRQAGTSARELKQLKRQSNIPSEASLNPEEDMRVARQKLIEKEDAMERARGNVLRMGKSGAPASATQKYASSQRQAMQQSKKASDDFKKKKVAGAPKKERNLEQELKDLNVQIQKRKEEIAKTKTGT